MPSSARQEKLWVVVGDIHDEIEKFSGIPELAQASGVIVTGDLTMNGGTDQAARVLKALEGCGLPVLAQIGNMDRQEIDSWLDQRGQNLHRQCRELAPEVAIYGIGGSTPTPFSTPAEFSEDQYANWLELCQKEAEKFKHRILVSHNPPKDTACDVIPGQIHVGSSAVRAHLEQFAPDLCLCGHIHEARSCDQVGKTLVINPGPLAQGGYALIKYAADGLKAELRIQE